MHRLAWVAFLGLGLLAACGAERRAPEPETPQAAPTTQSFPRFEDRDPHDWDGRAPWSYPVHGIDVSRWQGQIDWRAVRGSGISFVYAKATEGGDRIDPLFRDYRRDARRAGLAFGAYHFFYFCRPAVEQARWFIRNVPREGRELPHVLDMEWNHRSPTCRLRPDGAARSQAVSRHARGALRAATHRLHDAGFLPRVRDRQAARNRILAALGCRPSVRDLSAPREMDDLAIYRNWNRARGRHAGRHQRVSWFSGRMAQLVQLIGIRVFREATHPAETPRGSSFWSRFVLRSWPIPTYHFECRRRNWT